MQPQRVHPQHVHGLSRRDLLKAGLVAGAARPTWSPYRAPTLWGEEAGPPKRGGILRVRGRDPVPFDPHLTRNARTHTVLSLLDTQVDALIDRMKEAATEEAFLQAGHDLQRYIAEHMMIASIASVPFLQAARPHVAGYEHLHGFKIQFETTWLSR